ncbi:hypothetical protein [Lachnobacterium bovis]|jgi:hypothetical protein|uniref:Uncharacterized protein n=1 Tax=Lachnobacterium bovis DSM 14045 TaxID=1122142 RepID=A0A1H3HJ77_9FIRM|nr:hypothetical protein [Lachnobacterium bovis]SDY15410.1 hypothetical protein SAMN02910414_00862 [Lachnobacterium bovis DSM 14045]
MKRLFMIIPVFVLVLGMCTGCGKNYEAKKSTLFIESDGGVVSKDIEAFDTHEYSKESFRKYVNQRIDDYNKKMDSKAIKLKELEFNNDNAILTISYKSYKDYSKFNDIDLFVGSVSDAVAEGYSIDTNFVKIEDNKPVKKVSCNKVLENNSDKIVIIKANTRVNISGTIKYTSAKDVELVNDNTVDIKENTNLLDKIPDKKESDKDSSNKKSSDKNSISKDKSSKKSKKDKVQSDGSVDEKDLEVGKDKEEDVKFNFKEDKLSSSSQISDVFTYVVFD